MRFPKFLILVSLVALGAGDLSWAASFTLNSPLDAVDAAPGDAACESAAGDCTLRAAIMEANALPGTDEVVLAADTYTLTIGGEREDGAAQGDLDVSDDLVLIGLNPFASIVDGGGVDRVFHVLGNTSVQFNRVGIQNGHVRSNVGAGIYVPNGEVLVINSLIQNNQATGAFPGGAGLFTIDGTIRLVGTTVADNDALIIGGVINQFGTLEMTNSTVSGNTDGGVLTTGATTILNSTIFGNTTYGLVGDPGTNIGVQNSIIAGTVGGLDCAFNQPGPNISGTHNLDSDGSCQFDQPGDLPNTDPELGPLQSNPGLAVNLTHVPAGSSPVIEAADPSACPPTDQRGLPRLFNNSTCDIGAVESLGCF